MLGGYPLFRALFRELPLHNEIYILPRPCWVYKSRAVFWTYKTGGKGSTYKNWREGVYLYTDYGSRSKPYCLMSHL